MLRNILILLTLLISLPVSASTFDPAKSYPNLIGNGKLTWLFLKAYDAELRAAKPEWSYYQPFALTIRYNMNFSSEELVGRTIDEMDGQQKLDPKAAENYAAELTKIWPGVNEGDTITAEFVAKTSTVNFYQNGEPAGEITDPNFAKRFFDIWLGEKTSEPKLRKQLLGLDQ